MPAGVDLRLALFCFLTIEGLLDDSLERSGLPRYFYPDRTFPFRQGMGSGVEGPALQRTTFYPSELFPNHVDRSAQLFHLLKNLVYPVVTSDLAFHSKSGHHGKEPVGSNGAERSVSRLLSRF